MERDQGFATGAGAVADEGGAGGEAEEGAGVVVATAANGLKSLHLMVTRIGVSWSFILYNPSARA